MAADKRMTRAVYAAFIALAAAFIVVSVYDVAIALFGTPAADPKRRHVTPKCEEAVSTLVAAIDRGTAAAAAAPRAEDAEQAYVEAKKPEWDRARHDALAQACDGDPDGPAALAAVARLDRAAEAWVHRRSIELGSVRREVDSFIR